jgi:hypothetical protein
MVAPAKDAQEIAVAQTPKGQVELVGNAEAVEAQAQVDDHLVYAAWPRLAPQQPAHQGPQQAVTAEPAIPFRLR